MKIVLLDALTFGDTNLSAFDKLGEVVIYQTTTTQQIAQRILDTTVIVTNKVVITKELMLSAPSLKLICIAATGMNNVDLKSASTLGIDVKNVSGYSTDSVIQHTFTMLFYLLGHSRYYDKYVKDGSYEKSGLFTDISRPFFEIKGKKWGIVGLGSIGSGVAKIADTFGADVCYYSTSGKNHSQPYARVTLDDMMINCDIITIHAPLNEKTNNLIDYKKLKMCKDGATILNLGRGGIINEDAIAKIVDEKEIYIGLDVLTQEPIVKSSPLLKITNANRIYITPHIAWASFEARKKLIKSIIENIKSNKNIV